MADDMLPADLDDRAKENDIAQFSEERLKNLAKKLFETACDNKGKETDKVKSAQIFYEMALELKKQSLEPHGKISLIQSVGLLNAAIARNPDNVSQIEKELSRLCQHVLKLSKAENYNADLTCETKRLKSLIDEMRSFATEALKQLKQTNGCPTENKIKIEEERIEEVKKIQLEITDRYTSIMKSLGEFCENVMGKRPCEFAIAGLGSLARREITPYSDFEHVILLEDDFESNDKNVEYFRWFTTIFQIVVLNLKETVLSNLNIRFLNNTTSDSIENEFFDVYTKNGVSFDSMKPHASKIPGGRQQHTKSKPFSTELIKPVSKMLEYLSPHENNKNEYHLSEILTSTCFVHGDKDVYDQFASGVKKYKDEKTVEERIEMLQERTEKDLEKFSARFSLAHLGEKLNIKQMFYRSSTLFVSAFGKISSKVKSLSCFDIAEELWSDETELSKKHKILYAIALSCEIRLRVYMERESQDDYVGFESVSAKLLDVVGEKNIINYFQITYCLQIELEKQLKMKRSHAYSKLQFLNIAICYAMKLDRFLPSLLSNSIKCLPDDDESKDSYDDETDNSADTFDSNLSALETQMKSRHLCEEKNSSNVFKNFLKISDYLYGEKKFDESLEFFQRLLGSLYSDERTARVYLEHLYECYQLACFHDLRDKNSSQLHSFTKVDENEDNFFNGVEKPSTSENVSNEENINFAFQDFSTDSGHHEENSLTSSEKTPSHKNLNAASEEVSSGIERCDEDLSRSAESTQFVPSLNIEPRRNKLSKLKRYKLVALASVFIADCLAEMNCSKNGWVHVFQAYLTFRRLYGNSRDDVEVARCFYAVANAFFKLQYYGFAMKMCQELLWDFPTFRKSENDQTEVMHTYGAIASCHMHFGDLKEAEINFEKAVNILPSLDELEEEPRIKPAVSESTTFVNFGKCLMRLMKWDAAVIRLIEGVSWIIEYYLTAESESDEDEQSDEEEPNATQHLDQKIKDEVHKNGFQNVNEDHKSHHPEELNGAEETNIADLNKEADEKHVQGVRHNQSSSMKDQFTILNKELQELVDYIETEMSIDLADLLYQLGICNRKLNKGCECSQCFEKSLDILKMLIDNDDHAQVPLVANRLNEKFASSLAELELSRETVPPEEIERIYKKFS